MLIALYNAYLHPELYGRVLSQSGAFFWKPADAIKHEWIIDWIEQQPAHKLSVYLTVGSLETIRWFGAPSFVEGHERMTRLLRSKGLTVIDEQFTGGHDAVCWKHNLSDGLRALLGELPRCN